MIDVNNFITDLLDEFPARYATSVSINVDRKPFFGADGNYSLSNVPENIGLEELLEDLEALGITTDEPYFLQYRTGSGEDLFLKVPTIISSGKVMAVKFILVEGVTKELVDALNNMNPLRLSDFTVSIDELENF